VRFLFILFLSVAGTVAWAQSAPVAAPIPPLVCPQIGVPPCPGASQLVLPCAAPESGKGAQPNSCLAPVQLTYESAWTTYQPWRDSEVGNWLEANARVARLGGWRAYARESAAANVFKPTPKVAP